jgi:hypothetical protein
MKRLIFIIPVIFLLFKACKPDKGCVDNNQYEYQLERDLNLIPYKDFSELTFINKMTRDTSIFVGQGYVYDWGKYVTQEECNQTYNLQRRYIVFICTKNNNKISIENTFIKYGIRTMSIGFKNNSINMSASGLSKPYSFDSLIIENKLYRNINEYPQNNLTVFYNATEGIVKIIYPSTKDTLNLIDLKL